MIHKSFEQKIGVLQLHPSKQMFDWNQAKTSSWQGIQHAQSTHNEDTIKSSMLSGASEHLSLKPSGALSVTSLLKSNSETLGQCCFDLRDHQSLCYIEHSYEPTLHYHVCQVIVFILRRLMSCPLDSLLKKACWMACTDASWEWRSLTPHILSYYPDLPISSSKEAVCWDRIALSSWLNIALHCHMCPYWHSMFCAALSKPRSIAIPFADFVDGRPGFLSASFVLLQRQTWSVLIFSHVIRCSIWQ